MSGQRKSLSEAFPGLQIGSSPSRRGSTPAPSSTQSPRRDSKATSKTENLSLSLSKAFQSGWPHWRSIKSGTGTANVQFTVRLAEQLRAEANKLNLKAEPAVIIRQSRQASEQGKISAWTEVWDQLEESLIHLVYGSNLIETAGTSLSITVKLCRDVFLGKEVQIFIEESDPSYNEHMETLSQTNRKADKANVIRSRKEVVQHAKALNFMIDHIVLNSEPWSEELILEAHRMLYEDVDEEVAAGKYRDHAVAVKYGQEKPKTSICLRHTVVPTYMKKMVADLNNEIERAEAVGLIDPYTLAARYHHQFVMIHPFGDGNGRLSRIILNTLLLKYAGHVALIGNDNDKEKYLDVVGRGRKIFNREDMEVEFEDQTGHHEFARHVLERSKTGLTKMWTWASRRRRSASPEKGAQA